MPDFFPPNRELTIEEIVKLTGAKPRPDTPLDRRIRDIAPLDRARSTDITFLDNPKYLDAASRSAHQQEPIWIFAANGTLSTASSCSSSFA